MKLLLGLSISLVIALLSIGFIRFIRAKFPKHYFSLGQLIVDEKEDITASALILKFLPPLLFSFLLGIIRIPDALQVAIASSFFSSFLVLWPVLLCRDELLTPKARKRIKMLYLIYILYVTQYVVLAVFGIFLAKLILGIRFAPILSRLLFTYSQWNPLVQNIVGGFIGTALFTLVLFLLTRLYRLVFRRFTSRIEKDEEEAQAQFQELK